MVQTENEKMSLSTNTVAMFYSWAILQVATILCCSFENQRKQGIEARQPSPFLSQLPFEPHSMCTPFDLVAGMMILSNAAVSKAYL